MMNLDLMRKWFEEKPSLVHVTKSDDDRIDVVVDGDCELSLQLTGDGRLLRARQTMRVEYPEGDRASLTHVMEQAFERFVLTLGGLVDGEMIETETGWDFTVISTLYSDGVSQHAVMLAIDQQRKARAVLRLLVEDVKVQHELSEELMSRLTSEGGEPELPEVEDWVPSIDEVKVAAETTLVGDEREPLDTLEPDRWYETLAEVSGWVETIGDEGTFGWVAVENIVERRTRPVGPFASSADTNEEQS